MKKKSIDDLMWVAKDAREVIGDNTQDVARKHRVEIVTPTDPDGRKSRYSKKYVNQRLTFTKGFDFLQYNLVVRNYIVKRYNLKNQLELDILCYLFPIQYFTIADFKVLPLPMEGYTLKSMKENLLIDLKIKRARAAAIYGLSEHAKKAVKDYYYYLSGEKTMGVKSALNIYRYPEQTKIDAKREKVMLKLKRQSENFPKLFTNYHD